VDLVVAHEEARVLAVLISVEDVLTGSPDLRLFDKDVVDGLGERGGEFEEFFAFLREADDALSLTCEDLLSQSSGKEEEEEG
jgi:hypothetical protein